MTLYVLLLQNWELDVVFLLCPRMDFRVAPRLLASKLITRNSNNLQTSGMELFMDFYQLRIVGLCKVSCRCGIEYQNSSIVFQSVKLEPILRF